MDEQIFEAEENMSATMVVELPLKVMNTKKWCDYMRRKIEGD
jgi:hypothetical protein